MGNFNYAAAMDLTGVSYITFKTNLIAIKLYYKSFTNTPWSSYTFTKHYYFNTYLIEHSEQHSHHVSLLDTSVQKIYMIFQQYFKFLL